MIGYLIREFKKANTLPKNFALFGLGCLSFLAFFGVFFLEIKRTFSVFDLDITVFLQTVTPRTLDVPLSIMSLLGSFEIAVLLVLFIALFVFRKEKKIFFSLAFFGMILVFEFVGKLGLFHPGPPPSFFRYTLPFSFPTSYVETQSSFPSGHVSRTLFLVITAAFVAGRYFKKKANAFKIFLLVYAVAMVLSRIYLGEHWASDTIGGFLLGTAMGFFTISYF